jgi:hypothetical protein|tara:strand:- start:365 stop:565 length:201 start_codon:yes stop_codon:yes gene_type:complete
MQKQKYAHRKHAFVRGTQHVVVVVVVVVSPNLLRWWWLLVQSLCVTRERRFHFSKSFFAAVFAFAR